MSIIILWGTISSPNRGVNALTRSTIEMAQEHNPKEKIYVIGSGINFHQIKNDIALIPMQGLINLIILYIISLINGRLAIRKIFKNIEIDDRKTVLDLSEGDSFTDMYGYERFLYQILSKKLFINISNKYVLMPQTLGPFNNALSARIAMNIMKNVDVIIGRDYDSKIMAESLTRRSCLFCYDLAFNLKPKQPKQCMDNIAGKIGINISGLLWMGGYRGNNQFRLKTDYNELMQEICNYFLDRGHELVFVPHTYGTGLEDDLIASRELKSLLGENGNNIYIVSDNLDEKELKWIISRFEFFLGSRMHSCIAALSSGVPTIGISYSKKFLGVFESINAKEYVIDPRILDKRQIVIKLDKLFLERNELKLNLEISIKTIREYTRKMMNGLLEEL